MIVPIKKSNFQDRGKPYSELRKELSKWIKSICVETVTYEPVEAKKNIADNDGFDSSKLPDCLADMLESFSGISKFKRTKNAYYAAGKIDVYNSIINEWNKVYEEAKGFKKLVGVPDNISLIKLMAWKLNSQKREIKSYETAVEAVWKYKNIHPAIPSALNKGLTEEVVNKVLPNNEAKELLIKSEPIFLRTMNMGEPSMVKKYKPTVVETADSGIVNAFELVEVEKYRNFTLSAFASFLRLVANHSVILSTPTKEDLGYQRSYKDKLDMQSIHRQPLRINSASGKPKQRDPRKIDCYRDAIEYLWEHRDFDVSEFFSELTSADLSTVLSSREQMVKLLANEEVFNREMQVNNGPNSRKFSKHILMTFLLKVSKGEIKLQ